MTRDGSAVTLAEVRMLDNGTPFSERFGDVYFSADGGLDETRHTFLSGNGLPERWRGAEPFTIVETGFGTGLNFLAIWKEWRALAQNRPRLHYVSVEKHPLAREDLAACCVRWPQLAPLAYELLRLYPPPIPGFHRVHFESGRVVLTLLFGDACAMLAELDAAADAFFLDGFAPAKNPQMWTRAVFQELARLAAPGATLATYTVAGEVRRGLTDAGFRVQKQTGFGRKREMLAGVFTGASQRRTEQPATRRHAAVIGAGLAGTACAQRLVARGFTVDLVERRSAAAREASGNPAGLLHPALLVDRRLGCAVTSAAALHAKRELEALAAGPLAPAWQRTGVLQVCRDPRRLERLALAWAQLGLPEFVARSVDREEGGALVGARTGGAGYWFADGCWVAAASVCEARIAAAGNGLRRVFQSEALTLERQEGAWRVLNGCGDVLSEAPIVVLANAVDARRFARTELSLRSVRGQVTILPSTEGKALRAPVCGDGYITPSPDGMFCVGATFDEDDPDPDVRAADHAANLDRCERMLPGFAPACDPATLAGWVGFRAMSPDRLPLIGSLPGADNAGLFACLALGSRGLTWSSLAGEVVASLVAGDPLPIECRLADRLAPARFSRAPRQS